MIYYIEFDTAGNLTHVGCNPMATIAPVINIATWCKEATDGVITPDVDASGNHLAPSGLALVDPVAITIDQFNAIMAGGLENFTFDIETQTIVPKAPANAPAPVSTP